MVVCSGRPAGIHKSSARSARRKIHHTLSYLAKSRRGRSHRVEKRSLITSLVCFLFLVGSCRLPKETISQSSNLRRAKSREKKQSTKEHSRRIHRSIRSSRRLCRIIHHRGTLLHRTRRSTFLIIHHGGWDADPAHRSDAIDRERRFVHERFGSAGHRDRPERTRSRSDRLRQSSSRSVRKESRSSVCTRYSHCIIFIHGAWQ